MNFQWAIYHYLIIPSFSGLVVLTRDLRTFFFFKMIIKKDFKWPGRGVVVV